MDLCVNSSIILHSLWEPLFLYKAKPFFYKNTNESWLKSAAQDGLFETFMSKVVPYAYLTLSAEYSMEIWLWVRRSYELQRTKCQWTKGSDMYFLCKNNSTQSKSWTLFLNEIIMSRWYAKICVMKTMFYSFSINTVHAS